jgi:hypothetical protein
MLDATSNFVLGRPNGMRLPCDTKGILIDGFVSRKRSSVTIVFVASALRILKIADQNAERLVGSSEYDFVFAICCFFL